MNFDPRLLLDPKHLIESFGYIGVWSIIFAESGLLIGFFLPGDSLLFTAGLLASQNILNIWILLPVAFICAVLGDNVGYATGKKFGQRLFDKEESLFFHQRHIIKAQNFYTKHGKKTIVLARFMPIVRTFAPIVAGIGEMHYKTFFLYNLLGGLLWTVGLTVLGFFLGHLIPDIDKYLLPIILLIIALSVAPSVFHLYKERSSEK